MGCGQTLVQCRPLKAGHMNVTNNQVVITFMVGLQGFIPISPDIHSVAIAPQ